MTRPALPALPDFPAWPVLSTERLHLRWFTPADAGFVLRLLNDPAWLHHIGDRGVRTRAQAQAWIRNRLVPPYGSLGFGFWAVERRADHRLVGLCGLFKRDHLPQADVGFAFMPAWRGQGYAREAAAACLAYARDVLGLDEVWGLTSPSNAASARVLQAIGLRDSGVVRRLAPGDAGATRVFRSPALARGDDRARLDALVGRFFAAFGTRRPAWSTLPALPHYFTPDATVRIDGGAAAPQVHDVHGFIAPRAALILGGRLRDFEERETRHRTEIAGSIAQRWLRYEKSGRLDGRAFRGSGVKAMQFVRTPLGWKIAALAWRDDTPDDAAASSIIAP